MLDNQRIANFIAEKRRSKGLTQQQVADELHVSFQAVSKWERGVSYPNIELLFMLSRLLGVTTDEILNAKDADDIGLTYEKVGVDVTHTNAIKRDIKLCLDSSNPRILNSLAPFASLYDIKYPEIVNPILVLKSEEPGSKQHLAIKYGYTESICHDMVNHLVNDIVVMGARPLAILDTIVCGKAEKDTILSLIKGIAEACRANDCDLVGGELSVQPGVVEKGVYVLTTSIAGIVDRDNIINGSKIKQGDKLLCLSSNGLHTNGYSLVRHLMELMPHIANERVGSESFLDAVMKPHTPYYPALKNILGNPMVHGIAHVTGGGIEASLARIIPQELKASIDLSQIEVPLIFSYLKSNGNIADYEMLKTFNCGVGLIVIVAKEAAKQLEIFLSKYSNCYVLGEIREGSSSVDFTKQLRW